MTIERRYIPAVGEWRKKNGVSEISGYAATFRGVSHPGLGFIEHLAPGCFARSIREGMDVIATIDHKPELILGRVKNKSLRLVEDSKGLHFSVTPAPTSYALDLMENLRAGTVNECSFGFTDAKDVWSQEQNSAGDWVASRTISDLTLCDVALVSTPCYSGTSAVEANALDNSDDDEWNPEDEDQPLPSDIRAMFPMGIPAELRSRFSRRKGVIAPVRPTISSPRNRLNRVLFS